MDPWQKETLGLKVGDFVIWQDEVVEVEGQPAVVTPSMKVEVISPHDKPADIEEKMSDYRVAGVRLVWVVYPDKKCVVEYRPDTPPRTLGLGDVHEGHDVLPGYTRRLSDLLS